MLFSSELRDITFHGTDDAKRKKAAYDVTTFQQSLAIKALVAIKLTLGLPLPCPGEHVDIKVDIADDGEYTLKSDDVEWDLILLDQFAVLCRGVNHNW